ncbi:uncharacterized protein C8Q71DRAFT_177947 [Rhodofomes roseus]|uniref:Secreted protein n=1 Tax=Rhodofomes roseus TaxID=34475 RepID=A0ABQ8K9S5_9APHY|nr:uncharacterized protein C8Q71DRAFT_177947 [Rhodofomes roseus]KAH9833844.1 hypothetical protein C8Q71DRAFT_177947 [Rhodofomes roseus]
MKCGSILTAVRLLQAFVLLDKAIAIDVKVDFRRLCQARSLPRSTFSTANSRAIQVLTFRDRYANSKCCRLSACATLFSSAMGYMISYVSTTR